MDYRNYYNMGLGYVPAYQVSGKPFMTSSVAPNSASVPQKIEFPYVTKSITMICNSHTSGEDILIGMSEYGLTTGSNYFTVHAAKDGIGYLTLDIKCQEIWIRSSDNHTPEYSLYASLTGIPASRIKDVSPSGSNWSGSVGI